MLLRTLFVLLLFFALAETMVHGAHALAQAALRRQATVAVHDALDSSTSAAREAIAAAIAAGGDPAAPSPVAPSPSATCVLGAQNACALEATASVSFAPVPSSTASPCPNDACTIYEQANDTVNEGRIEATIAAQALTAGGAVLAARTQHLSFRTLAVAPYAALAGQLDDSVGALSTTGQGDDGGAVPIGTAPGTLIDVLFENQTSGATMPANVWRQQVQQPGIAPRAWSP